MEYIRESDLQRLSPQQIRALYPNVSFPATGIPLDFLAGEGIYPLVTSPLPDFDPATQRVEETTPERVNDTYERRWLVVNLTQEEIAQRGIADTQALQTEVPNIAATLNFLMTKFVDPDTLTQAELGQVATAYPPWEYPKDYVTGNVVSFAGGLYKVLQPHTSQAQWTPPAAVSLFAAYRLPGEPWVQPLGAQDAYALNDTVTHDNPNDGGAIWLYESLIAANTTEPGRDGTLDRFWKPVRRVE